MTSLSPLQVSAKQKALRQKTLRVLYDTNHSLHDVWAGVQECVAARDKEKLDAATTRSTATMMSAVELLLAKYRPNPEAEAQAPLEGAEGRDAADGDAPADE